VKTRKSLFCLGTLLLALVCCFDTAYAQNNTLTCSPCFLTFSAQGGVVSPPSQTVLITSQPGPVNVTVTTTSTGNWLIASPGSGTTALSLTVSVGAGGPASGTDTGFVNVSGGGTSISVAVTLNVNVSGPSPLSANPNSLSYSFQAGNTVPVKQAVTITSNNGTVTSASITTSTSNGGAWLSTDEGSLSLTGNPPTATLHVNVSPSALVGAGPFNGAIAINPPGTTGISIPVQVTVQGTPTINTNPAQLAFAFQLGTGAPAAQTISVTSSTGVNVAFSAAAKTSNCGSNWLIVTPQNAATPGTLSVQLNTALLTTPANCNGEVDITASGAANPSVAVPVSVLVTNLPLLQVPSTGPTFNYQIGTSTQLAAQNVQITSSSTPINFTAGATPVSNGPNFLVLNPTSGTTPQALALSVNSGVLAGLGPGTFSETVTIASAGAGNSPQSFTVTLIVSASASLVASVPSLNFNDQIGQPAPQSQTFTVSSTGAPLAFQVATSTSNCSGFFSATVNGTANGLTFGNQNQVVVSVNLSGLTTPQVCSGNITLSVQGTSTTLIIPVTLTISSTVLLNVSTSAINVTALVGGQVTVQAVGVTTTDNSTLTFSATAATNPIGLTWLSVAPNSGNTPNNLQVTINPANLAVGTYPGTITVSSSTPNVPSQTIQVTLTIVASNISATPSSLTFAQATGGSAPPNQTVTVNGVPAGAAVGAVSTMFNGTGWLSASVSGNIVTVTVNGSLLVQAAYTGVVTIIVPGAGNSPLYVPVTLTVGPSQTLVVSPNTLNFTFQLGGTVPTAQTVQVASSGGSVTFNAVFNPTSGGNFVTVTPASSGTPGQLTVTPNAQVVTNLTVGNYTGQIVVTSPSVAGSQTINVTLSVVAAAQPVILAVVSGASFAPGSGVSPGEIISIFGTLLGPAQGVLFTPNNGKVDAQLAGTTVMFDNVAAPLIYVSANQINAIVPYEVAPNAVTNVRVIRGGVASAVTQLSVVATTPAIFSAAQTGNGQGAILNQNNSANSANNPAPKGSVVQIYATGEGSLTPPVLTGTISGPALPLPKPIGLVSVTIGGVDVGPVDYAGEAPTLVSGVLQVNVHVPTTIPSGNQLVVLTVGPNKNVQQAITVAVQ